MYIRRSTLWKYVIALLAGAALYSEWFVFVLQPWYWQRLECQSHNGSCTKILFIADPQIQGDTAVSPPLSYLFNWDSDRYLKSTYSAAFSSFKPDFIVYLGDMTDEGSIATVTQFYKYANRLTDIFYTSTHPKYILLPGDNDIGGENEPVRKDKLELFEEVYAQPTVVTFRNITFYAVNGITHTMPKMGAGEEDNFKIVVSHYPLTIRQVFTQQINNKLHPNIYFCAHEHSSKYVKQNSDLTHREVFPFDYGAKVLDIYFDNKTLYEIYVPTCSYRMGTGKIGFGAAILDNNNQEMRYTVFWSPRRFPYLYFYLGVLIFVSLYCIVFCAARLFHSRSKSLAYSADKQPLLDRI